MSFLRFAVAVTFLAAGCSFAAEPTIVILVRHAERIPGEGDVSISDTGRKRSAELGRVLADSHVRAIYVSTLKRTQQTAAPLATKLGLALARINEPPAIVADIRKKHLGKTVVVIHHSNTLPDIAKALGVAPGMVAVGDKEFDALFVVADTGSGATMTKLRYGAPSIP